MELLRQVPLSNGGSRFEARAFAAMYHLPFVVRSAEFANVDGVLDCKTARRRSNACMHIDPASPATSFADRFYAMTRRASAHPSDPGLCTLVPFDVKGSASHKLHNQKYKTTLDQRRHTAFYICFCAADPKSVEVIPNGLAGLAGEQVPSGGHAAVTRLCEALVTPCACHFLNPCNTLYSMLLELLPVALNNIRACVLD
ncbi:hypothetical protein P171DRAFT_497471 [Karstenula rhodostoma CBS 690.94]|uniref:Uncharacterized protein n=1 Tax=Karstenula rhodostoma CBS 690.94 TaxID=1392251 RepID=A0A9P4PCL5_9PLEO|nr:hypothetical protein P171DRAFT_497471 [Karstenula rhodostoma CBS 690.94]